MTTTSELATEAARLERLSGQVGDRDLSRYYQGKASAIRKQLDTQRIMDSPEVERAMRRFVSDLQKAGVKVSEVEANVYPNRVRIEAR